MRRHMSSRVIKNLILIWIRTQQNWSIHGNSLGSRGKNCLLFNYCGFVTSLLNHSPLSLCIICAQNNFGYFIIEGVYLLMLPCLSRLCKIHFFGRFSNDKFDSKC